MKTFTLTLTEHQIQIIGAGLGELPLKIALPLVNAINAQVAQQQKEAAAQAAAPDTAAPEGAA